MDSRARRILDGQPFRNVRRDIDFLLRGDADACEKNDRDRDGSALLGDPTKGLWLPEDLLAPPEMVKSSKYPIMDLRRYGLEGVFGSVGEAILVAAE